MFKRKISVQLLSRVRLFATPWTVTRQASLSITISWSLHKLMSIESVIPSNTVIPFSSCLQSFPESGSFLVSQFFISVGQSIGVSASTSSSLNYTEEFKSGVFPQVRITSRDKFYLYMAGQTSDYPTSVLLLVP